MGSTRTPSYRVEEYKNGAFHSYCGWDPARLGPADEEHLARFRAEMNASFKPGGTNAHVSQAAGYQLYLGTLRLVHQKTGAIVAQVNQPLFEVI
jgi:hypothetical protein